MEKGTGLAYHAQVCGAELLDYVSLQRFDYVVGVHVGLGFHHA